MRNLLPRIVVIFALSDFFLFHAFKRSTNFRLKVPYVLRRPMFAINESSVLLNIPSQSFEHLPLLTSLHDWAEKSSSLGSAISLKVYVFSTC